MGAAELPFAYSARVRLGDAAYAEVVARALAVDPELHGDAVRREVRAAGAEVVADFSAADAKHLRATVSSFFDLAALAVRACEQFG